VITVEKKEIFVFLCQVCLGAHDIGQIFSFYYVPAYRLYCSRALKRVVRFTERDLPFFNSNPIGLCGYTSASSLFGCRL
jgi:hypothetical protein